MLLIGGAYVGVFEILVISVGAVSLVAAGELLLDLAGMSGIVAHGPAAILLGATTTNLFLLAGVMVTTASNVFMVWTVLVAAASFFRHRVRPSRRAELLDGVALVCMTILVGFWSRHAAAAIPALRSGDPLPVWTDYYIHATTIAQFGNALAAHRGSTVLADQPWDFYHYSSYMLAAALGGAVNLAALGLATAAQLPIGLLLGAIGSYAAATTFADRRAGVIAIACLTLLPDPSQYWFSNGYFAFFWMLFTSPGSGYALGSAVLSLLLLFEWHRTGNRYALLIALGVGAAMFEERAQIFLWYAIAVLLAFITSTAFVQKHRRAIGWSALAASAILIGLLLLVPPIRTIWLGLSAAASFLDYTHMAVLPTAYEGFYAEIIRHYGQPVAIVIGTLMLVPIVLGIFVIATPAALAGSRRQMGWKPLDAFPFFVLFAFLFCVWFAPIPPGGDFGEYKERPFVLLYQVAVIWTAAYICRILPAWSDRRDGQRAALALILVTVASTGVGLASGFEPARPRMDSGKNFFALPLQPGLIEAADYVRFRSRPEDTVAVAPPEPQAKLTDRATEFASLTDIPSYLARANMNVNQVGPRHDVMADRLARLNKLESTTDLADALNQMRVMPVTWYVWIGVAGPSFDPTRSHASFVCKTVSVYRVGSAPEPPAQANLSCKP
jgi:hypothetical protein